MLLGRFRGTGRLAETQRRPRRRPACAAWRDQNGAHRLPTSFIPSLQAQTLSPGEALQPEKHPSRLSGDYCSGTRGLPIFPSPTSHSGAGTTAAAHGRKDPEELAEADGRALQGAGREENPGVQAQATESQARSRSGASEDVGAQERSAGWSWGYCLWGWSWRLGTGLGRD